ncbi:hypothetical protein QM298_10615 [Pseudomonas mendocina]|nr:hypothetical protein [Pseudomonas mendocina]MDV5861360.1 hypothetical protein [Pseudomonas mendocina]
MTVKRYDMSGFGDGMVEREDGAFYYMDDYHALLSLNAELLDVLGKIEMRLEAYLDDDRDMAKSSMWLCLDYAEKAIAKARSQS